MSKRHLALAGLTALLLASTGRPAPRLFAAPTLVSFTVDSTLDQVDDNVGNGDCHTAANTCTLRAAIMEANKTSGAGATIIVPAGLYTLTIPATLANGPDNGDLDLLAPESGNPTIDIIGAGAAVTIIDANQLDRVVRVGPNRTASLTGVTLRNGYATGGSGGGLLSEGNLTVNASQVVGNQSLFGGGGLFSAGMLTLTASTVSSNLAQDGGGGLITLGDTLVRQSTVSDNRTSIDGGGFYNAGSLILINTTVSQNLADRDGGAIYNNFGAVNVYNSTIFYNGADADADENGGTGAGIYNNGISTFNLRNTVVAGNYLSGAPIYNDCDGILGIYGNNLFWAVDGCYFSVALGSAWAMLNSLDLIGPLLANGGPTRTHALRPGSNAIDGAPAGLSCVDYASVPLPTDQRGAARDIDGDLDGVVRCDVGAFEYRPPLYLPLITR